MLDRSQDTFDTQPRTDLIGKRVRDKKYGHEYTVLDAKYLNNVTMDSFHSLTVRNDKGVTTWMRPDQVEVIDA